MLRVDCDVVVLRELISEEGVFVVRFLFFFNLSGRQ